MEDRDLEGARDDPRDDLVREGARDDPLDRDLGLLVDDLFLCFFPVRIALSSSPSEVVDTPPASR